MSQSSSKYIRLLSLFVVLCVPPLVGKEAQAKSKLSAVGSGDVVSLSHRMDIRFGRRVFQVDETLVLSNRSQTGEAEGLYTFQLPARAAITNLSIKSSNGLRTLYGVVGAKASTRLIASPPKGRAADAGLLRMIESEGDSPSDRSRYELRVFPIPAGMITILKIHWTGLTQMEGGLYNIRIPSPGIAPNLARPEIHLQTTMPMLDLYGGSSVLTKKSRAGKIYTFFGSMREEIHIQGHDLRYPAGAPRAEVALFPLSSQSGIAAISVTLPPSSRQRGKRQRSFARAIFLLDTSTSLGPEGLTAEAALVDAVLKQLPSQAQVQSISFARDAYFMLRRSQVFSLSTRERITTELSATPLRPGSNLQAALELARKSIDKNDVDKGEMTLLVIVSDGLMQTDLSSQKIRDTLSDEILATTQIMSLVLVPPHAPLPDLDNTPLANITRRTKGRTFAVRQENAAKGGRGLLAQLQEQEPLSDLRVVLQGAHWIGGASLGSPLHAGSRVTALAFYEGKIPKKVTVYARTGDQQLVLPATKISKKQSRALAAITIATTAPFGMPTTTLSAQESEDALRSAAVKLAVVSQSSAGIAISAVDGWARERLLSARRWGAQTYRRLPPPAERIGEGSKFAVFSPAIPVSQNILGRAGVIDREIIARRVRAHVIPPVRHCYEKLLRSMPQSAGSVQLHFEFARGEVSYAGAQHLSHNLEPIRSCILDAMYSMPIPKIWPGEREEKMSTVLYPLRFRLSSTASTHRASVAAPVVEPSADHKVIGSDPLEGLGE